MTRLRRPAGSLLFQIIVCLHFLSAAAGCGGRGREKAKPPPAEPLLPLVALPSDPAAVKYILFEWRFLARKDDPEIADRFWSLLHEPFEPLKKPPPDSELGNSTWPFAIVLHNGSFLTLDQMRFIHKKAGGKLQLEYLQSPVFPRADFPGHVGASVVTSPSFPVLGNVSYGRALRAERGKEWRPVSRLDPELAAKVKDPIRYAPLILYGVPAREPPKPIYDVNLRIAVRPHRPLLTAEVQWEEMVAIYTPKPQWYMEQGSDNSVDEVFVGLYRGDTQRGGEVWLHEKERGLWWRVGFVGRRMVGAP